MKKSEPQHASPPVKVVGFHVEGASPSPRDSTLGAAGGGTTLTGSPSPVIIPPSFQGQRGGSADTSPARSTAATPGGSTLKPIRTESQGLDPSSFAPSVTPPGSARGSGQGTPSRGAALPLTPVGASAPADLGGLATTGSSPLVLQPSPTAAAPAVAAGLPSPTSSTAVSPFNTAAAEPAATAAAAAPAAAAEPAAAPASAAEQPSGRGAGQPSASTASPKQPAQQAAAVAAAPTQDLSDPRVIAELMRRNMKELSRPERRAVQEHQRAQKAAEKAAGGSGGGVAAKQKPQQQQKAQQQQQQQGGKGQQAAAHQGAGGLAGGASNSSLGKIGTVGRAGGSREGGGGPRTPKAGGGGGSGLEAGPRSADMFAHLQQYRRVTVESVAEKYPTALPMHAVVLGLKMAQGTVRGANTRCAAMLKLFVRVIQDLRPPPGKQFAKELMPLLNSIISFLVSCRPLCVSMAIAIKSVKRWVGQKLVDTRSSDSQMREELVGRLEEYLQKMQAASTLVAEHAAAKVGDGEVLLTFGWSSAVLAALLSAHQSGKRFTVMVVDSRPSFHGRRLLTALLKAGVRCHYLHSNALSYALRNVDKVLLGAGGVMSNGTVLSCAGTAAVAMMAAAERIPVLVLAETHKFHERVQLDSITHNELGDPGALAEVPGRPDVPPIKGDEAGQYGDQLRLLNLTYDLTPADYVSVIVTELGAVPATSVAVILREAQKDATNLL